MLIKVLFDDGSKALVDDSQLALLIQERKIIQFLRSDGWVQIDTDPIRRCSAERRQPGRVLNTYV